MSDEKLEQKSLPDDGYRRRVQNLLIDSDQVYEIKSTFKNDEKGQLVFSRDIAPPIKK